ncbi:MAG: S8 family serine peptidase, partial [Candidatus Krumholzibacteriia bacterium]
TAASAINYARQNGAAAVNCSWGSSWTSPLQAAVSAAINAGLVVVVSAGNDDANVQSYLASRGDCFDVAASANNDAKASFSNFGAWVDITAPGVSIYSTYFDHNASGSAQHTYTFLQGTSMAAPLVTGLVGLVKAHSPALQGSAIMAMIEGGADDIDAINPAHAGLLGAGRVNALRTFGDFFLTVPNDYPNISKALSASGEGDTIAMIGGAVLNEALFLTRSNRLIQGGWDATFTSRDPNNPSIMQATPGSPALEFAAGVDTTLVLDGLRFTGGTARQLTSPSGKYGGGVLCVGASPVLRDCRFDGNVAGGQFEFGGGGGGFFDNASARLVNCVFENNVAQEGGGLYALNSSLQLDGCLFDSNTVHTSAASKGGGLYVDGGTLTLTGCQFSGNNGVEEGGAVYVTSGSLVGGGVVFTGNSASMTGGAVRADQGGFVTLSSSEIRSSTGLFGAGVALANASTLDLTSTILAGNVADLLGGGIYAVGSDASLANVTFDANDGGAAGGDAVHASSPPSSWTVRNCVISNHTTSNVAMVFSGTAPTLDYNLWWNNTGGDLSGSSMGANALIADPSFVDQPNGDLALGLHSPALDSGDGDVAFDDADGSRNDRGAFGGPAATSRAPASPSGLVVDRLGSTNDLSWDANPEADVEFYAVYRDPDSTFVPSLSNFVGSSPAGVLSFLDLNGSANDWYRLAAVDSSGASSGFSDAVHPTAPTDTPPPAVPQQFALRQNEPNPFNPLTRIRFDLPHDSRVRLEIFDARGRRVRQLVNGPMTAGVRAVFWDGRDENGRSVGSGVYVYRILAADWSAARKMTLVR